MAASLSYSIQITSKGMNVQMCEAGLAIADIHRHDGDSEPSFFFGKQNTILIDDDVEKKKIKIIISRHGGRTEVVGTNIVLLISGG